MLGVPVVRRTDGLVGFRLADRTVVELYGPDEAFHAFFSTGPVVAFRVDDFGKTREAMLKAGVRFIGERSTPRATAGSISMPQTA